MRLDLAQPLGPDLLETRHAVRECPLAKSREPLHLRFVERDDELAAPLHRDVVHPGERFDQRLAVATQLRLQRPRRVVQPGMQDAAVVPGLVRRELRLLLEDREAELRAGLEKGSGGREPEDPPADDDDVEWIAHGSGMPARSPMATRLAAWTASI